MRGLLFIILAMICQTIGANTMDKAYQETILKGSSNNATALNQIQKTDTSQIKTQVDELKHTPNLGGQESSKNYALTDEGVKSQYDEAQQTLVQRAPIEREILDQADAIANNPDQYATNNAYCDQGDCQKIETGDHTDQMVQNTAILDDVLGGGVSYSTSGNQARIYTGKAFHCRAGDSLGNSINCCKEKGWLVNMGLRSCSSEEKALGIRREKNLCIKVGEYDEAMIDTLGIEIGKKKYEGYCCFHSEMAKLTHKDGRTQLTIPWGGGKHPNCQGFTPDQFAALDFSQIDLEPIYDDINNKMVTPNPDDLLKNPSQYYHDQGIASW